MQRLLQRNEHAIASAQAATERARLLAQRVLLLARHWRIDDVPEALSDAEAAVAASADRRAAAELSLARGVARYYGAQINSAQQPVQEARDAAILLGDAGFEAECEAWLGCVRGTLHHDPNEVLPHLRQAVRLGTAQRPLAAARGLYVVATLYHEADMMDEAVRHYRRASSLARAGHDEQLIAAVPIPDPKRRHSEEWQRDRKRIEGEVPSPFRAAVSLWANSSCLLFSTLRIPPSCFLSAAASSSESRSSLSSASPSSPPAPASGPT